MTPAEKDEALLCYDRSEFELTLSPLESNNYRITGKLCEREAYKDIRIKVSESSNWKFYVGAGIATAAVTGIYLKMR